MTGVHHAAAYVGIPRSGGRSHQRVRVHLWMIGSMTLGTVGLLPRWACNRRRRRAAWTFELAVLEATIDRREESVHA